MESVFTYTPSGADWARFAPELIVLGAALLVLLTDLMGESRRKGWLALVGLAGVVAAFVAATLLYAGGDGLTAFAGMVSSDKTALFADCIILLAAAAGLLYSPGYIERQGVTQQGEYYALLLLATFGMLLLASAASLMTIFIGLETLSLALYILSAYIRARSSSQEAGMKYFILSSFASAFLLYGMALTYGATGATNLSAIARFVANPAHPFVVTSGFGPLLLAGMGLMAVGFLFKVSAVPFQAWTPDVYAGAPTSVTAFMSVGTKVAAFVALARVFLVTLRPLSAEWTPVFWAAAILTMVAGSIFAVTQRDVKRLLAYSSIANAGYMLIAIATGTPQALASLLIYLGCYAVMNLGAFGVVVALELADGRGTSFDAYAGLARTHPGLAAALALFLFALAGIPPTAGFAGKYFVFFAAITHTHLELAVIGVLSSMLGMYYYLRVIWQMYFVDGPTGVATSGAAEAFVVAPALATVGAGAQPAGAQPTSALAALASAGSAANAQPKASAIGNATAQPKSAAQQSERIALPLGVRVGVIALALLTLALGVTPQFFEVAKDAAHAILR